MSTVRRADEAVEHLETAPGDVPVPVGAVRDWNAMRGGI